MSDADHDPTSFADLIAGWDTALQVETVSIGVSQDEAEPQRCYHATVLRDGAIRMARDLETILTTRPGVFALRLEGDNTAVIPTRSQFDATAWAISLLQDRFGLPVSAFQLLERWPSGSIPRFANAIRARRGRPPSVGFLDSQEINMPPQPPSRIGHRDTRIDPVILNSLRPHLIDLWGGKFSRDGLFQSDASDIDRIFEQELPRRLATMPDGKVMPIVLYAHGGLVDEATGLMIAANQIPWWNANGCYPLQFIWETGLLQSLEKIIGQQRDLSFRPSDITDRVIELAAHTLGGVQIWGNMKNSAAAAFEPDAAGSLVAERLVAFVKANSDKARLHAIGHSAGSIFHAYLLRRLDALNAPPLETLTYLAPAITVDAYLRLTEPLIPKRAKSLRIFTMQKDWELRDTVTELYRKSLLYLIRDGLETQLDEPVLGLEESLRGNPALVQRFGLAGSPSTTGSVIWSVTAAKDGADASTSTSHGGFDNDVPTMNSVARRVLGIPDTMPLPRSFPEDTEQRAAVAAEKSPVPAAGPVRMSAVAPLPPRQGRQSRRVALCVGINAYPAPNSLDGCVADSDAWAAGLEKLGFVVDKLQDVAANHKTILGRLTAMVEGSQTGDTLVFQYAGHGTQVPDLDGDETDANGNPGPDQAICPVDFETGDLIIDDDIRAVLDRLPAGVHMTCFLDSCHSGTATRFLVGRETAPPDSRARFVRLRQSIVDLYVTKRASVNSARALASGRRGAGTRDGMRWVAFAACNNDESAWETDGHGDFTRRAILLLETPAGLTNSAFQDSVLKAFGPQRRQTPWLDCRDQDKGAPFLLAPGRDRGDAGDAAAQNQAGAAEPELIESAVTRAQPPFDDRRQDVADLLAAIAKMLR